MPPSLQVLTKAASQQALSEQLFGGALLIFKAVPAMYDFCDVADELVQEVETQKPIEKSPHQPAKRS